MKSESGYLIVCENMFVADSGQYENEIVSIALTVHESKAKLFNINSLDYVRKISEPIKGKIVKKELVYTELDPSEIQNMINLKYSEESNFMRVSEQELAEMLSEDVVTEEYYKNLG